MPRQVDIIMLSLGKNKALIDITNRSIETLLASEYPAELLFNIVIIESNGALKPYQYPHTTTLYPQQAFGYHKYMNIGLRQTKNNYICLCNNDLIFHKNWASAIINAMDADPLLMCASPYDENYHQPEGFPKNSAPLEGYLGVLSGWCIFAKRSLFDIIGQLDEDFIFWYCDADFCQSLISKGVKHCLVSDSFVTHLGSKSLRTLEKNEISKLTELPRIYYDYKWQHRSRLKYLLQLFAYRLHFRKK